ncbi:MAG: MarR family transcriptional regulator [Nocardioidaceae bacterium]|nr:MarR family transcriptional regulator [Nocardioidaceae bacterium]
MTIDASGQARPANMKRVAALKEVEAEIAVLIRRVRRVIGDNARTAHPELQPASYLMLGHVRDHGPLRAADLACVFNIDKGAVSRQVRHLIGLGLLECRPDPEDGRATLLNVSEDAIVRLTTVAEARSGLLAERLEDWPVTNLTSFAQSLRLYNEALE